MFEIKKATLEDIPLINKLAWIVFPHTYKELLSPGQIEFMMDWMYSPTNLKKQMTEDGHTYFIAYEGDEPAGYLSIQPEGEHTYHLQKIYVLPSFQGKKLGKQLLFKERSWASSFSIMPSKPSRSFIRNLAKCA